MDFLLFTAGWHCSHMFSSWFLFWKSSKFLILFLINLNLINFSNYFAWCSMQFHAIFRKFLQFVKIICNSSSFPYCACSLSQTSFIFRFTKPPMNWLIKESFRWSCMENRHSCTTHRQRFSYHNLIIYILKFLSPFWHQQLLFWAVSFKFTYTKAVIRS